MNELRERGVEIRFLAPWDINLPDFPDITFDAAYVPPRNHGSQTSLDRRPASAQGGPSQDGWFRVDHLRPSPRYR